ncbi:MAG TPA: alpha/beta hydrolase [Cyanobacteria bacterium UBA11371]|nr:alpha/beta hydrolase [Cyanobacteria bacterium UBA11371]HBE31878.1 alpha/beta hydrolase [Cyanobacteria bacterium UBA11368]
MTNIKALSIVFTSASLLLLSPNNKAGAVTFNPAPIFEDVASYTTTISANNDIADIYFPNPPNLQTGNYSFPVALLLQGFNVDKSDYSNFASIVARYGFVVVVPNSFRTLPPPLQPVFGNTALFPQISQIDAVLAQIKIENSNPVSPVAGIVNTEKLGLLGHSAGGAVGLSAIANICLPFICDGSFSRPKELVAGAFFGANLRNQLTGEFIPINNSGIPTALLQGNLDSIALPVRAQITYDNIQTPPKALVSILGANHYGITNSNNPRGPVPDSNAPTIAQDVAVETVARWSGLFLRASILDDKNAFNYVYSTGDATDPNVTVVSVAKPVPEPANELGLLVLGVSGAVTLKIHKYRRNKSGNTQGAGRV